MAHPLRVTQKTYADKLDQIDRSIQNHKDGIAALEKERKDVEHAKAGIDKLVADLPAEPKKAAPAVPKKSATSA